MSAQPVRSRRDELRALARHELADHLRDAATHAGNYVDDYVDTVLANRQFAPQPRTIHPLIRQLVREIVLDALALERRAARASAPRPAAAGALARRFGEWERQDGLLLERPVRLAGHTQPPVVVGGVRSGTAASGEHRP